MADAISNLIRWAGREEWREGLRTAMALHLDAACEEAGVDVGELETLIGHGLFSNLWGCVFEDFLTWEDDDGRNVVDDYLKRRGWKESAASRQYLTGLRVSSFSLYEVSGIVPGESCLLRDLIRGGEPLRVSERTATRSLKPWDRIGARLVGVGSKIILGGGLLPYDRDAADEAIRSYADMKRIARGKGAGTRHGETDIRSFAAPLLVSVWLEDILERALDPRVPEVRNTDGDEILFTTVRFPLAAGVTGIAVRDALGQVAALEAASDHFWNWVGSEAQTPKRTPRKGAITIRSERLGGGQEGMLVLGSVEFDGTSVALSVNSSARAERGRLMLAPVLAGLVGSPETETQTLDQLRASRLESADPPELPPTPEVMAAKRKFLDEHYTRVLDEKLPALGNRTPRQVSKTRAGRAKVASWLKQLENNNARMLGPQGYDATWIWEELGVSDLRC